MQNHSTLDLILLVFSFVCFALAAIGLSTRYVNLIALGLAFFVLTFIV
jgi:hypothetical protein